MEQEDSRRNGRGRQARSERHNRSRAEVSESLYGLGETRRQGRSDRSFYRSVDVPRSTVMSWDKRQQNSQLPPSIRKAFETPEGLLFLHRIVLAIIFVLTQRTPAGFRLVCELLELSGLSDLVACSYGSIQAMGEEMERELVAYGEQQRAELEEQMQPKDITVCQDETFHPETCLVASEPVSNFLFIERYTDSRDMTTWSATLDEALGGLPVRVCQTTSDQAKALIGEAAQLGVNHSPDLFHPLYDLTGATTLFLSKRAKVAHEVYAAAVGHKHKVLLKRDTDTFAARLEQAEKDEQVKKKAYLQTETDKTAVKEAIRQIATAYHPYHLTSGALRSPETVAADIRQAFAVIDEVVARVSLSERCQKRIDKARRVVDEMVATIRFVHLYTATRLFELELPPERRAEVLNQLIPGLYLSRVAGKASCAAEKYEIASVANRLLASLRAASHPLRLLEPSHIERIETIARDCADIFQRSSSCVEGRNGQLSLFHHGVHRLSQRKLSALTVVHNFHIKRSDGTTAAERFFGQCHESPFVWLVERMQWPAYPAKKRPGTTTGRMFSLTDERWIKR